MVESPPEQKMLSRQKPRPRLRQRLRFLLATFLLFLSVVFGSLGGLLIQTMATLRSRQSIVTPQDILVSLFKGDLSRKTNILLLGTDYNYVSGKRVSDEEAGTRSRTDTIMLASLDPATHRVSILSIPRDTRVLIPDHQYDKINAAMTYGGVDLVKKTVTELTGVPIDYYMALKVDGLVNTIDILGGIRIYVEKDMHYQDDTAHLGINIHKGWKDHMNGQQAHGYIRFRHDELGDIGRVQRQQKFISAVLEKLLEPSSWLKFPALMEHLNENIETDIPHEMFSQMIKFGTSLKKEDLRMVMLPGTFENTGGVSYWAMYEAQAHKVIAEMFGDPANPEQASPSPSDSGSPANPYAHYRVAVWNATDDREAAQEVVRRLEKAGWSVLAPVKAPSGAPRTRFIAQNGQSELLKDLASSVGYSRGEAVTASIGDLETDFTILIEDDLAHFLRYQHEAEKSALPKAPSASSRP